MPWSCHNCRLVNDTNATNCSECGTARPADAVWACPVCTLVNDAGASVCGACNTARPFPPRPPSRGVINNYAKLVNKYKKEMDKGWTCSKCNTKNSLWNPECINCKAWRCPLCTLVNEPGAAACAVCRAPKPAAKGGSLAKRRKTKRRKYTKRRRACQTRRIKKQNRS